MLKILLIKFSTSMGCCTGERMTKFAKNSLKTLLISFLFVTQGCQLVKKEIVYPYPDCKETIINSKQFGAIQIRMSESEVFNWPAGCARWFPNPSNRTWKATVATGKANSVQTWYWFFRVADWMPRRSSDWNNNAKYHLFEINIDTVGGKSNEETPLLILVHLIVVLLLAVGGRWIGERLNGPADRRQMSRQFRGL